MDFARLISKLDAVTNDPVPAAGVDDLEDDRYKPPTLEIQGHMVQVEAWAADTIADPPGTPDDEKRYPPQDRRWHMKLIVKGPQVRFNGEGLWRDYTGGVPARTIGGVREALGAYATKLKQAGNQVEIALA